MAKIRIFHEGQRVKLLPHLDLWMRGATRGTVVKVTANGVRVRVEVGGVPIGAKAGVLFRKPADALVAA